MPRTWPSIRLSRFASAVVSAPLCATTARFAGSANPRGSASRRAVLRGDVIPCVLDSRFQHRQCRPGGVVDDRRRAGLQRYDDIRHAWYRLQHTSDARDTALTRHACYVQRCVFHHRSSLTFGSLTDPRCGTRNFRSNSALPTTDTELIAIAAPATTGLR